MFGLKSVRVRIQYQPPIRERLGVVFDDIEEIVVKQQFTVSTHDFIVLCDVRWTHPPADIGARFERLGEDLAAVEAITEIISEGDRTLCSAKGVFDERYAALFDYTTQEFLCFIEYPVLLYPDRALVDLVGLPADIKRLLAFLAGVGVETEINAVRKYHTKDSGLVSVLTEKQVEVVKYAYDRGFFESPRPVTARALAADLGIAHTTLLAHIRKSQQRLFAALFEDGMEGG